MQSVERINAFVALGNRIETEIEHNSNSGIFKQAEAINAWFTPKNIKTAFEGILKFLKPEIIKGWIEKYNISETITPKTVGVVMAGNIPLVGFHDFMTVLMAGHNIKMKLSSKDNVLMKFVVDKLIECNKRFAEYISITNGTLKNIDAIIATGSNNSSRYFEYYFAKYPHIIRRNRTSAAIITGDETTDEIKGLAKDVLMYFGLGCRNVSKLFLPPKYNIFDLMDKFNDFSDIIHHHKYANNYNYQKALLAIARIEHFDNGFLLFRNEIKLHAPVGVVNYENYHELRQLIPVLDHHKNDLQCIVTHNKTIAQNFSAEVVPFGEAQFPEINQYADNVDTMEFCLKLNKN